MSRYREQMADFVSPTPSHPDLPPYARLSLAFEAACVALLATLPFGELDELDPEDVAAAQQLAKGSGMHGQWRTYSKEPSEAGWQAGTAEARLPHTMAAFRRIPRAMGQWKSRVTTVVPEEHYKTSA